MIMRATARPKFEHGNLFPLFPDFSFDVLLLILEQCSPMDIAQLFYTSNRLRCLIESHPHLWLVAFANLSRGDAPSPPLCPQGLEAARNYSVVAYVTWIFGGGKCTYCRRETMALPFQFALKFRACKKACDAALRTPKGLFVDKTHKFDDFNWGKYLPRVLSKPQRNGKRYFVYAVAAPKQANREMEQALDVTKGRPLRGRGEFLLRTISELQEELEKRGRDQTAIQQNALDLAAWKDQYISEREKVEKLNQGYVRDICFTDGLTVHGILKCPTFTQVLFAFNRDLAPITISVWLEIKPQVLLEYNDVMHCTVVGTIHHGKTRCSFCSTLVKIKGLSDHVVNKHPNINPNTIPKASLPAASQNKIHCLECPLSKRKRVFTKAALVAHKDAVHSATK